MKRQDIIDTSKTDTSVTVTVKGFPAMTLDVGAFPPELLLHAAVHGVAQKMIDAGAISRDPETGKPATAEDKHARIKAVFDRLAQGGPWNAVKVAGPKGGTLFAALCVMYAAKRTPEQVREWLDGKSKAEQHALRTNPQVADAIRKIEAEYAAKAGVDSDAMLGELN